jgi:hypothetical protein
LARVAADTFSGRLKARDTVMVETPARAATSSMRGLFDDIDMM